MTLKYLSNYTILREIGRGSQGMVYEAIDNRFKRKVAIKSLKKEFVTHSTIRSLFLKEANEYLHLNHVNIVSLHDLIVYPDAIYIIMEYIKGVTLEKYIELNTSIHSPKYFSNLRIIFLQVLSAINYAHSNNKLHLDIKPSNILIKGDLNAKVVDFGVSNTFQEAHTAKRTGTPLYMSPEQVNVESLSVQTDIYNLGVTMAESYAKKHPYSGEKNKEQLFNWVLNKPVVQDTTLPYSIRRIITRATEKRKRNRFRSCSEFYNQLYRNND